MGVGRVFIGEESVGVRGECGCHTVADIEGLKVESDIGWVKKNGGRLEVASHCWGYGKRF